ncbi:hypothetical protein G5V59_00100 [Nocardioides sp. W3-2-3]|uniref:hypothetical protein n=1 Tax=Nocardioides convexus TaxID=2712224 RepID=UPI00241835C5|nr:hypothetical protein [Nocardioides convexus]NGZ99375.1 hypothetical protein [Nocardioides convexus]
MTAPLFDTRDLGDCSSYWRTARDGDPIGRALYDRHYSRRSYRDGRRPSLFVGPGEKLVLLAHDDQALLAWRRFHDASGQRGVNCAVFRNEGPTLASRLLIDAEQAGVAKVARRGAALHLRQPAEDPLEQPWLLLQAGRMATSGKDQGGHGREPLVILERLRGAR